MLKIGELARKAGVSVDTVRFYERRGLLPPPVRRPSGYRIYESETAERIRLAKFLQALGFTLDEIVLSLSEIDRGIINRQSGEARLEDVRARIDSRINDLQAIKRNIDHVITECRAGRCRLAARFPEFEDSDGVTEAEG